MLPSAARVSRVPSDNLFLISVSVLSPYVLNYKNKHLYHLNESRSSRLWLKPRTSTLSTLIRAADWRAAHHTRRGDRKWQRLCVALAAVQHGDSLAFSLSLGTCGWRDCDESWSTGPPCEVTRWFYKKRQWQNVAASK